MVFCIKYRKKLLYDTDRIEFFKEICTEIRKRYKAYLTGCGTELSCVQVQ